MVEEIVRKFDDAEEQAIIIEKVLEGRLDLEYLLWNGRTRTR